MRAEGTLLRIWTLAVALVASALRSAEVRSRRAPGAPWPLAA